MRLVCPNCEAKYEVPDDAIPDTGRDVQCASCGHAWFQMRPRPPSEAAQVAASPPAEIEPVEPAPTDPAPTDPAPTDPEPVEAAHAETDVAEASAEPAEVASAVAEASAPEPQPDAPSEAPSEAPADLVAEPAVEEALAPVAEPEIEATPPLPADATPDVPADAPEATEAEADIDRKAGAEADRAPYAVDESVLAILREEAEREAAARRADARAPEAQPDPGISIVAAPIATEDKPSARRDLLPDVEEINSTLRPSEMPAEDDAALQDMPPPQERSGGFRSGFLIVMTVAMIGAAVYMSAPSLSRMLPALAGPLDGYVGMINGLRLELDGLMRSATVALGGT